MRDKLTIIYREMGYPYQLIHKIVDPLMDTLTEAFDKDESKVNVALDDLRKVIIFSRKI